MTEQNYGLIREVAGRARLRPIPQPDLPDGYLLVRPEAIALNPTDWTTLEAPGANGTLVGCDYAGVVVKVGKGVQKDWEVGDRIAGTSHGGNDSNPQTGAFARFIIVKGDVQLRVPESTKFEDAASIGVGINTAGFGLYKTLGFPYPQSPAPEDGRTVLIYGGSTATGTLAIQLAKLSGLKVVTTCSPKNTELVKSRGADLIFDYRDADVAKQIREATDNELAFVFDTVSTSETAAICADAFGANGGHYVSLLGVQAPRPDVKSDFILIYDMTGEAYIFEGEHYPADPSAFEFTKGFLVVAEKLWAKGLIKPHPLRVNSSGLIGAVEGLQILKEGKYSGEKLVYRVEETDWPT